MRRFSRWLSLGAAFGFVLIALSGSGLIQDDPLPIPPPPPPSVSIL